MTARRTSGTGDDDGASFSLPGFEVVELLGYGGSAEVWLGRELATGDPVALKRVRAATPAALDRIKREAGLLATLDHPHVLRLRSVLREGRDVVLVLDYADGGSLTALLSRRGTLPPAEVVTLLVPLAQALAAAHARGVVHGDVTPSNVLLSADGRPLLADLGVSRVFGERIAGVDATAGFVDPAVGSGASPSPASDVYGLAATCWTALAGAPPVVGRGAWGPSAVSPGAWDRDRSGMTDPGRGVGLLPGTDPGEPQRVRPSEPLGPVEASPSRSSSSRAAESTALMSVLRSALAVDPAARPSASELAAAAYGACRPAPIGLLTPNRPSGDPQRADGRLEVPATHRVRTADEVPPEPAKGHGRRRRRGSVGASPRGPTRVGARLGLGSGHAPYDGRKGAGEHAATLLHRVAVPGMRIVVAAAVISGALMAAAAVGTRWAASDAGEGVTRARHVGPRTAAGEAGTPSGERPAARTQRSPSPSAGDGASHGSSSGSGPATTPAPRDRSPRDMAAGSGSAGSASVAVGGAGDDADRRNWVAVLAALDRRRSEAFAAADPRALRGVYAPQAPELRADHAAIAQLRRSHRRVSGYGLDLVDVRPRRVGADRALLDVTDRLRPHVFVGEDGQAVGRDPGRGKRHWTFTLVRGRDGWRIADIEAAG
ncbi:MAG: protein kinase [Actinomycetota bacterium]|nr:protein kinase [Actinomycetota bacterium]